ncbi:TIGR01440 family protein [Bacillus sp. P14.5]|uniref:TIGR01440 family protein n=1 Tax=Bacillus sp. P14.5 TaxID=1983400 RepID=UPI000DEA1D9C|nr:TIGR01440 family protein [Bacillus sp. P14.5]
MDVEVLKNQLNSILKEFKEQSPLKEGSLLVIGCSTSEVIGQRIGTAGTFEAAEVIFNEIKAFASDQGAGIAFQCCEHLNRALVMEREWADKRGYEEVSVIPARAAGGAMATYAYEKFEDPVVVEFIKAEAGIDIGQTFIGMHMKHVAVPIRVSQKTLGEAHVSLAKTRPKLIGGTRAVYEPTPENKSC